MKKAIFETADWEIVRFDADVITTSTELLDGESNPTNETETPYGI